jgi:glutathione synthase/RimK-type ligase-like ATP-grasp enzyme
MMFQERIPKATELRVAYVAGRTFTGVIDASQSAAGQTDWRRATPDECRWQRGDLPEDITRRLVKLMKRLGLIYGGIDLIRTPEDDYVFLEVNPAGEWGMLERDLDYPISEALADALLNRKGMP